MATKQVAYMGPVPRGEESEKFGADYNQARAMKECRAYVKQLRREHGKEPRGVTLRLQGSKYEGMTAYNVVIYYDIKNSKAAAYAIKCCGKAIRKWDAASRKELRLQSK